jgi:hypothetical protein
VEVVAVPRIAWLHHNRSLTVLFQHNNTTTNSSQGVAPAGQNSNSNINSNTNYLKEILFKVILFPSTRRQYEAEQTCGILH